MLKKCVSFICGCGLGRVNILSDEGRRVKWKTITENKESMNFTTEKWKKEIDSRVSEMGLDK